MSPFLIAPVAITPGTWVRTSVLSPGALRTVPGKPGPVVSETV